MGKAKRIFKERRALIACTRCRHLKKGCKQVGRERCQRCVQTDQVCVYMDVANDPTAPRPPGSSSSMAAPDSPPNSPSEPPSPFEMYRDFTSTSQQSEDMSLPPHLALMDTNPNNHNLLNPTPSIPNVNAQAPGHSIPSSFHADGQSPSYPPPPDSFAHQPLFDTIYPGNGVYEDPFGQLPAPFTSSNERQELDIADPSHSPHYLRSRFNPSPLSHSNVQALTAAHAMSPPFYANSGMEPYTTPLLNTDFPSLLSNQDHTALFSATTPTHSPVSYLDDLGFSSYGLCSFCSSGSCTLHSREFAFTCDSSTDDELC